MRHMHPSLKNAELRRGNKLGQTPLEYNCKVERFFWQRSLAQEEHVPRLFVEFMYGSSPVNQFVSVVDMRIRHK